MTTPASVKEHQTLRVRGTWNDETLRQALRSIKLDKLSTYKASDRYGIPRRTLRRYLDSNQQVKAKLGTRFTLTDDQNDELVDRLLEYAEKGHMITAKLLRSEAYRFCEKRGIKHHFSAEAQAASYKWVRGFLRKNTRFAKFIYCKSSGRRPDQQQRQMNEGLSNLDVPAELSGISQTELHQHAMSLCESLLAEYSSNSDDVVEIKEEKLEDNSFNGVKEEKEEDDYNGSCHGELLGDDDDDDDDVEDNKEMESAAFSEMTMNEDKPTATRGRHAKWTVKTLKEALSAVKSRTLTVHTAALRYKIPRSTLRRYVTKDSTTKAKIGIRVTFNKRQNAAFCSQVRELTRKGYTVTPNFLRGFVYKFCEENGIKHSFSKEKKEASYKWMLRFLRKNPELLGYVHKNTVDPTRVPNVDDIVPNWVSIDEEDDDLKEDEGDDESKSTGGGSSMVEQQIFVDCASPTASVQDFSDGEVSPAEDPLGLDTSEGPKKLAKWTQATLQRALNGIKYKNMSTHQAAKKYNIPRSTLRRYFIAENDSKSRIGKRSLLDNNQEAEICAELRNLSNNGIPLSMKTIKSRVFEYCEKYGVKHSFCKEKRLASYKVVQGLLRRNPMLEQLMQRPFGNPEFEPVMILDEGIYKRPTFVECEVDIDEDSSGEEKKPQQKQKQQQLASRAENERNQEERISFPESIGLFEMVAGAYGVS